MKTESTGKSTPVVLVVLVLFYILLLFVILIFFQQIFITISITNPFANIMVILVMIILPLLLLGAIILNVFRLFRDRAKGKPGSKFKIRLILFFAFIIILSTIPQVLLSVVFINSAVNTWFGAEVGDVLRSSLKISLEYYNNRVNNLETFCNNPLLVDIIKDYKTDPEKTWTNIKNTNPEIDLLQIFNNNGAILYYYGIPEAKLPALNKNQLNTGPLGHEKRGDLSIIRYQVVLSALEESPIIVMGIILPPGFQKQATTISDAREIYGQLERYKDLFPIVVIGFYSFFSLPILLLSIIVSFLLSEEIMRPIVNLEQATRRVAEGDFSFRILSRSSDELAVLINSFNKMVLQLAISKKKLVQAEKISAWQEIAQRLAHEIKNPLTPIKLSAQRVLKKYKQHTDGKENKDFAQVLNNAVTAIIDEVERLNKLLKEFSDFAKLPALNPQLLSLKEFIQETATVYKNNTPNIDIECNIDDNIIIKADHNQIKQVFSNLILNAIQAMPDGGKIFIYVDLVKKDKKNYCRIQVRDLGEGIPDTVKSMIFDPYFTTKQDGVGLGLSIVERIVFDHDGDIWFESEVGAGTTFFIDLPIGNN